MPVIRTLHDINFEVLSPSLYMACAWPGIVIEFTGAGWRLTCGQHIECFKSVNDAAARLKSAAKVAAVGLEAKPAT